MRLRPMPVVMVSSLTEKGAEVARRARVILALVRDMKDYAKGQEGVLAGVLNQSRARLLVVDDSPTEQHVLKNILVKAGFQVVAKDGTYRISFTDEDFSAFFRSFVRDATRNALFGN